MPSHSRNINTGTDINFIEDPKVFFENDLIKWDYSFALMILISATGKPTPICFAFHFAP